MKSAIYELIASRRSIRRFSGEPVAEEFVQMMIEAGTWAPSGLNNQPWKFAVIRDSALKEELAGLTHYSDIVHSCDFLIAVFLDAEASYDRTKDIMAIGACIQNMLLYCHSAGLGAVWLGEILKKKDRVRELLSGSEAFELMAVVAAGHPAESKGNASRRPVSEMVFFQK